LHHRRRERSGPHLSVRRSAENLDRIPVMRWRCGLVALLLLARVAGADALRDAQTALLGADYASAATLAEPLTRDPTPTVRAEADRVLGLALFALGGRDD